MRLFPLFSLFTLASALIIPRNSINDCGDSSFESTTSAGSPHKTDCEQLARNIASGGTWTFNSGGTQWQLASYGSCAFGAQTACLPHHCPAGGILVKIGNQDIINVITESVKEFTNADGLVGAKGIMDCQEVGDDHPIAVLWGIYATGAMNVSGMVHEDGVDGVLAEGQGGEQ